MSPVCTEAAKQEHILLALNGHAIRTRLPRTPLWSNFATVYMLFVMDLALFRFSHPHVPK